MTSAGASLPGVQRRFAPAWRNYRFELIKLLAQWPVRLAILNCWLAPAFLVTAISQQSALPAGPGPAAHLDASNPRPAYELPPALVLLRITAPT